MKIENILIYGSAHLTREACDILKDHYNLVGHIPSVNPVIAGEMNLPIVDETIDHDIKLSIQYNRKITDIKNAFNIHTGLLPSWGGVDILYHTIKDRTESFIFEQGLTFHKMTSQFDYGPIISRTSYPVTKKDTVESLYEKIQCCLPAFTLGCLKILEKMSKQEINQCYHEKPRIFKRGQIKETDKKVYSQTLPNLRKQWEHQNH